MTARRTMRPMRRRTVLSAVALVMSIAAGCGGSGGTDGSVRVIVTDGSDRMVVMAEVAATPERRATGLMNRTTVPNGTGMLFVFPQPVRGGFWMKDTRVGLHILFISGGRVVEIRSMQPCRQDPCPVTTPAGPYDQALEVPLGTLGAIDVGASVQVFGPIPDAR